MVDNADNDKGGGHDRDNDWSPYRKPASSKDVSNKDSGQTTVVSNAPKDAQQNSASNKDSLRGVSANRKSSFSNIRGAREFKGLAPRKNTGGNQNQVINNHRR